MRSDFKRLPVLLENIRIATPCSADWDEMSGTETVRHCGKCEKNVYNLSAMTRAEAEAFVGEREGLCLRFYQRADGTVLTSDCPVGVSKQRLRARVWSAVSGAVASLALFVGLAGRAGADVSLNDGKPTAKKQQQPLPTPPLYPMMGGASANPNPQPPQPVPLPPIKKKRDVK